MEGLKRGRIVYFVFDAPCAEAVNRRRLREDDINPWPQAAQRHIGSTVTEGDILPAMVTRVCDESGICNLKVMLDGSDTFWATSVVFAEDKRSRSWHWMFDGQQTRYRPDRVESTPTQR